MRAAAHVSMRAAARVSSPSASLYLSPPLDARIVGMASLFAPGASIRCLSCQINALALSADTIQAPAEALPMPRAPQRRDDLASPRRRLKNKGHETKKREKEGGAWKKFRNEAVDYNCEN
jgi:hypothetical protein